MKKKIKSRKRILRKRIAFIGKSIPRKRVLTNKRQLEKERKLNLKYQKKFPKRINKRKLSFKVRIKKQTKKKTEKQLKLLISQDRIRQQYVMNFKYSDNQSLGGVGFISIRAITIDETLSEKALKLVCENIKAKLERVYGIDFKEFDDKYGGLEKPTKLGTSEDKQLNDYNIHYEYFINKKAVTGIWK